MRSLGVFCGSAVGDDPAFAAAATKLGALLAERGIRLVYGGGSVGLMGVLADEVLRRGGEVVGVIPRALWDREVGHRGLTDLRIVDTMHQRKALMAEMSDGFVALPGGIGTMDELFEIWTWAQLGVHRKPVGLFEVAGYYRPLIAFLDAMTTRGFIRPEYRSLLLVAESGPELLERLQAFVPPDFPRWVRPSGT